MKKMSFGWWYVRYAFTYEPMKAFRVWEDEYKRQFPQYSGCSTLEMVDIYADYCSKDLMPKNFVSTAIDAVIYPLFKLRRTFYFFLIFKHKISYRISKLFNNKQTEIIAVDNNIITVKTAKIFDDGYSPRPSENIFDDSDDYGF